MPSSVSDNGSLLQEEFSEEEAPTPSIVPDEEEEAPMPSDVSDEEGEASPLPSSSFDDQEMQQDEESTSSSEDPVVLVDAGSDALVQAIQAQTAAINNWSLAICILLGFLIGVELIKGLFVWKVE